MSVIRCINLDWLEVYCLESRANYPHDAEFFRSQGWEVREREYGTPVYKEMFTLYGTDGLPLLEIRRAPKSAIGVQKNGVLDPLACHIRLSNRTCYMEDAAGIMQQFLNRYDYQCSRISRLDIALDFEKFDSGDEPQAFIDRYLKGRFSKINQARLSAHGLDQWDGRYWNSLKWGQEKSMVSTKLYDKTMELKQTHDKPYIRQAWFAAKLVDDMHNLIKYDRDNKPYNPRIWRLEFSIKSSRKNWFVVEDVQGRKKQLRSIKHTLDNYHTRAQLFDVFFSLVDHYFHFKYVQYIETDRRVAGYALNAVGVDHLRDFGELQGARHMQRKDRCRDKVLFKNVEPSTFYKVTHVATSEVQSKAADRLLRLLYQHREKAYRSEIYKACNILIEELESYVRVQDHIKWSSDELTIMRQLIARRIKSPDKPFKEDIETLRALMALDDEIFGENR